LPTTAAIALSLAAGFLLGSLPFGYWLGRMRGINLLETGSGSIGATNVFRKLGWKCGVLSFLLDMGKGAASILGAKWLTGAAAGTPPGGPELWVVLAGMLAVVSHSYSFWLGFRGGRGVATGLGLVLAISVPLGLCAFGVWAVTLAFTRYVSLSSILGVASANLWGAVFGIHRTYLVFIGVTTLVIILRHLPNMRRLAAGTEPRLGSKRRAPAGESEQGDV
jgi:glycerol-3-phosphate acyltransferase PlsY